MSKDANGAITEFLSKINHLDEANKAEVLGAIFGAKQAGKVRILADRLTELKSAYAIANDAKSSSGALDSEVAIANEKLSQKIAKLQNAFFNISVAIGESLKPAISAVIDVLSPVLKTVSDLISAFPRLTSFITISAMAFIGLKSALLAVRVAGLASGLMFNSLRASIMGLNLALLASPVGLVVGGLVAGGALVYSYWQELGAFFSGFWDGFKKGFSPVLPIFEAFGTAISFISELFSGLFTKQETSKESLQGLADTGARVGTIIAEAFNLILAPLRLVIDGVKKAGDLFSSVGGFLSSLFGSDSPKGDNSQSQSTPSAGQELQSISELKATAQSARATQAVNRQITDNKQITINMHGAQATPQAVALAVNNNSYSFDD